MKNHRDSLAFTLMELMTVCVIIAIFALAVSPILSNYLKQNTALGELKSYLELARTTAIKRGTYCYVAFLDDEESKYAYGYCAIYIPNGYFKNADIFSVPVIRFVSPKYLPDGVIFAIGEEFETQTGSDLQTVFELPASQRRAFPVEPTIKKDASVKMPFIVFNSNGEVVQPQPDDKNYLHVGLIPGYFDQAEKQRIITKKSKDENGETKTNFAIADLLLINRYTGRIRHAN